jgi:hypothetical protein
MSFNEVLTEDQRDIVDAGGYIGRDYILFCPNTVVLQCHPAAASAEDVIAEFEYDSVVTGAYTDVYEGQVVIISTTTDLKATELWRGRIRELPTSSTLYINESSILLDTAYYVTVIDTHEPMPRLRSGNFVDWNTAPEGLQPLIKGLQSAYLKEPDALGEAEFTFSPVGQALEEGATIDDDTAWEWDIDGTPYTTREVTVTLAEGHYWARVWLTDSEGVTSYFAFQVIVADEDSTGLVRLAADGYEVTGNWDNGWNGSVTYFAGIEDVLDRTRVVIVSWHQYRDGDPAFPNISFVGYLREEDDSARADENYSALAETRYTLAGFGAIAGEMPFNPLAIRNLASPTLWDEINLPTTERAIAHILTRYTTLLTLCALDFGTLTNDHFGGDMDVSSSSPLDACNTIASEINAQLIFAPCGQITLDRNACFLTTDERNALDVITTPIHTDNMLVLAYKRAHVGNLAQIQIGFRTYYTADNTNLGVTATAPAIAYADGMDFDTAPNQLLLADSTPEDAQKEARQRAGHLLAYRTEGDEITIQLDDGWGWLVPSQHQWWSMELAASVLTAGRAFSADDRLLLKSITHTYSAERGTRAVNVTFLRETRGKLAAVRVEIVPSAVTVQIPYHPPLSAYLGAFPPANSLRMPSLTPNKRQPYKPRHHAPYMPLPPAIADEIASSMGQSGCYVQNPPVNFRNPANVATNFLTVLGEPYLITVKGSARIGTDGWIANLNLVSAENGFAIVPPWGAWTGGTGYTAADGDIGIPPAGIRSIIINQTLPSATWTSVTMTFDIVKGTFTAVTPAALIFLNGSIVASVLPGSLLDGTNLTLVWTGSMVVTDLQLQILSSYDDVLPYAYGGSVTLKSVVITGTGTDPFTGNPGGDLWGDAFYHWTLDEEGEPNTAQLYTGTQGLIIDNAPVAVPPIYSPTHEYPLAMTGTGNTVLWRYAYPTQAQAENLLLYVMICGAGAGS